MKNSTLWIPFTQMKVSRPPMRAKGAKGSWIYLEDGRKVLDGVSSWWVNLFGHGDAQMATAIGAQAQQLDQVAFADFIHEPALELSRLLLEQLPNFLTKVFYSDNGSTANEVALKLALQYWYNRGESQRRRFICFEGGYHGDTFGAMSAGSPSIFNRPFQPLLFNAYFAPFPELDVQREARSLALIEETLRHDRGQFAAIVIEPLVQGAGGMRMCRPEFLQQLQRLAHEYGLLTIYDEVMTGFGRTGDWFACCVAETEPDMICLAKGITGGYLPLSATVVSEAIFDAFYCDDREKAFYHGHTYMGNPIACRAGIETLLRLKKEETSFKGFARRYDPFLGALHEHPAVENVRVQGTILAFDLIAQGDRGYANPIGKRFQELALEKGLYLRPLGNVVYLLPAYNISNEELCFCFEVLLECCGLV